MTERRGFRLSRWDRFLVGIAPRWGMARLRARAQASLLERNFDAAGTGRRTSGWHRSGADANTANARALPALRELSRDLRRNNGWARRGIKVITNNTVGWGIEAKALSTSSQRAARALSIWKSWSRSPRCDYDGRMPFAGLQRLVMSTVVESGEALVVRERANGSDGLPVPLRIRVLEPDFLDASKMRPASESGGPIEHGVEYDGRGRRVAYWLFHQHPGSNGMRRFGSRRVPAEDVLHVYDVERAGQARGVPWLCAAIAKLNDFDDFDDATLMQQKIAACFAAFVHDMEGVGTAVGEQSDEDERLETLEPGHIEYLSPGKQVQIATPPQAGGNHATFSQTSLRRIAASIGVTYEDLTGDYSQVNFSSARMARHSHWASVYDWRWNMLIPQLCDGVWRWVMESAASLQGWTEIPAAEWSPPPMPMLEPEKEGLAYTRAIRSGVKTLPQVLRERGEDAESHLKEIAESNKMLDDLGIVLDSDPRRTSAGGLYQPDAPAGETSGSDGT